ncbi:MAG TPA: 2-amino-4-hydroxy-6-hydroxymethyldihydropteridine diphosphokinase, partial [Rhodanobacteraceae bacterium]|nr:2-amino-4-hydroxy-6-hydroxymethyldihydropteridine diphosphokinase [Rhodanobacteraceae bacterium]
MAGTVTACIALGSNLEDPREQVRRGFEALATLPQSRLLARSRLYRTSPWGITEQPDFINAAARLETSLTPRALLDAL